MDTVVAFVGSRHPLQVRQRVALTRALCSEDVRRQREARERLAEAMAGRMLLIDGFNLMITLEVALSGGVVLVGYDGALRDLAGLRGTFRLVQATEDALRLIGLAFQELQPGAVSWFLDRPVSNSGRLRERLLEVASSGSVDTDVPGVPDPDRVLVGEDLVVSADAAVIDASESWVNLLAWMIERYVPSAWAVSLAGPGCAAPYSHLPNSS